MLAVRVTGHTLYRDFYRPSNSGDAHARSALPILYACRPRDFYTACSPHADADFAPATEAAGHLAELTDADRAA